MSKANGKKEVIDKIKNWLKEESIEYGIVEQVYADFQADLRNPSMSVILFRSKTDSIHFETYVGFTEQDKKTYVFVKKEKSRSLSPIYKCIY